MKKLKKRNSVYFTLTKKVRITKISDDSFSGKHPNGINEGYVKEGLEIEPPTIGMRYWLGNFSTSPIIKIMKGKFKTVYSTYKYEILKDE